MTGVVVAAAAAGMGGLDSEDLAGFGEGDEEDAEEEEAKRRSQDARAENMDMIQSTVVHTAKEMMRW